MRPISSEQVYERIKKFVIDNKPKRKIKGGLTSQLIPNYDIRKGEKVLVVGATEWDPEVILAYGAALRERGVNASTYFVDLGLLASPEEVGAQEARTLTVGEDNVAYCGLCNVISFSTARAMARSEGFDAIMAGTAGPLPPEMPARWYRTPYVTVEEVASEQIEFPIDLQLEIDNLVFRQVMRLEKARLVDPEGTDISWTQYQDGRPMIITHEFGKPVNIGRGGKNDCTGVVAGTVNHLGCFPRAKAYVKNDLVVKVEGGGKYGNAWREKMEELNRLELPAVPLFGDESKTFKFPGPGFFWYWEMAIGTRPGVFRLNREGRMSCFANFLHDRVRSGYVHSGFGVPSTSVAPLVYTRIGVPWTHVHLHSMFPTLGGKTRSGERITIIEKGRLQALDDPRIRRKAAKYGDPDKLLEEAWIPAIPGVNARGSYGDYAKDPFRYIKREAEEHPIFPPALR